MKAIQSDLFENVHESLLMNNAKMTDNYAKYMKAKPPEFKVGDKVKFRKNTANPIEKKKSDRKLYPKKGFYVIKEIDEKSGNYRLRKKTGKKVVKTVKANALVMYTGPEKKARKKTKLKSTQLEKPEKISVPVQQNSILPKRNNRTRFATPDEQSQMWFAKEIQNIEQEKDNDSDFELESNDI